ncbi:hypothetical protein QTP88_009248 [Uroleucon formosanum]
MLSENSVVRHIGTYFYAEYDTSIPIIIGTNPTDKPFVYGLPLFYKCETQFRVTRTRSGNTYKRVPPLAVIPRCRRASSRWSPSDGAGTSLLASSVWCADTFVVLPSFRSVETPPTSSSPCRAVPCV